MAQIRWTKKAQRLFFEQVLYAYNEFGTTTAKRWQEERKRIESQLAVYPESYTAESLLKERLRRYRSCHIMGRFKIVYYYAKSSDIVHIVDIWDMLMSPENLKRRIK